MAENKKPCAPVEEAGRDYTTVFVEDDPLCAALDELCMALNCWYATMNNPWQREDRAYRRQLAKNLRDTLKQVVSDEWEPTEYELDKKEKCRFPILNVE